ncbi:hypothetical protein WOLCODRAFT_17997 [Wolfiporia cocos MD-104 SS10]|uniref:Fungal-type protein kinase domain-containing protein n=1 Tax=Wolfiporia cocos (strain MD-104) TaxID=742152 RepID=A0A2H3JVE7_WOLCO|nr:hypothetical protein WOLCODRAFT_17997 [Wolfiporia cocos MD-104 SS10]
MCRSLFRIGSELQHEAVSCVCHTTPLAKTSRNAWVARSLRTSVPSFSPAGDMRCTSSRPDGCLLRADAQFLQQTANDNSSGSGYKKGKRVGSRDDDVHKIMWLMHHCMRNDPSRRFVLGFTIEDNDMRLWFLSSSDFVVSQSSPFDCETFTKVFLALLYSSESDLCWDPSIRLVKDGDVQRRGCNNIPVYDITVYDRESKRSATYRTTRVLSDVAVSDLYGMCMRVFAARRVENGQVREGEPEVVIKDSWTDEDRRERHEADGKLHEEDPRRIEDGIQDEEDGLEDYLLTVLYHVMMRGKDLAEKCWSFDIYKFPSILPEHLSTSQKGGLRPSGSGKGDRRSLDHTVAIHLEIGKYPPKYHYRVVYKEVCDPLYCETSSKKVLKACSTAMLVLQIVHRHGWVHPDMSPGNLLLYGERVELADWEYVSHKKHAGVHEIRTGIAYFMAVEVDKQKYLFLPPRPVDKEKVLK